MVQFKIFSFLLASLGCLICGYVSSTDTDFTSPHNALAPAPLENQTSRSSAAQVHTASAGTSAAQVDLWPTIEAYQLSIGNLSEHQHWPLKPTENAAFLDYEGLHFYGHRIDRLLRSASYSTLSSQMIAVVRDTDVDGAERVDARVLELTEVQGGCALYEACFTNSTTRLRDEFVLLYDDTMEEAADRRKEHGTQKSEKLSDNSERASCYAKQVKADHMQRTLDHLESGRPNLEQIHLVSQQRGLCLDHEVREIAQGWTRANASLRKAADERAKLVEDLEIAQQQYSYCNALQSTFDQRVEEEDMYLEELLQAGLREERRQSRERWDQKPTPKWGFAAYFPRW
ncbi:hypothetical protein LTR09_010229 [Extremus antarcticus]|uniref:Uncharacterized protein n=1 Tax=Extremus antarcticus TaxID=702011 RepID=A0AAJ0G8T3_9PEZI|nr:hypothetical protein LTR09_010229 [Extremus antarcticus]